MVKQTKAFSVFIKEVYAAMICAAGRYYYFALHCFCKNILGFLSYLHNLAPAPKKKGPSVETDWPLTIACHMKKF
jgi:hypothetical protein